MSRFFGKNKNVARRRRWIKPILTISGGVVLTYGICAYAILPAIWRHYEHNPKLANSPKVTHTSEGIPGDPVNIGVVGTRQEVVRAMLLAGWYPADSITIKTSIGIAGSVLLKRAYPTAPVSNLYFFNRQQDLAFEQPAGSSANQRHHVRFWQSPDPDTKSNRPLWIGSATFDRSSGFSHLTGKITHHIAADIDAERNATIESLVKVKQVVSVYQVTGVGATLQEYNGGGDRYFTDGEMTIALLSTNNSPLDNAPIQAPNPPAIQAKHHLWQWLRSILH
ncbi:LssY C-terminal domain-containing protein [Chamaesiphon sp. GL140_3_metabinner_50]|uniref:LssY C-terminal domain-containing protein n=1 Tax=Chamaesiphon sp. GL140_3_metabinner_50 TaxID=2970812 RepID=UPI0025D769C0|nr:LssY C-terminal domain-containing protein [Chamaesiphon sp. GL140_3_metabinner_50]